MKDLNKIMKDLKQDNRKADFNQSLIKILLDSNRQLRMIRYLLLEVYLNEKSDEQRDEIIKKFADELVEIFSESYDLLVPVENGE